MHARATTSLAPFVFATGRPRRRAEEVARLETAGTRRRSRTTHEAAAWHPASYVRPIQVRFSDVDLLGHVNNVRYFDYVHEAQVELLVGVLQEARVSGTVDTVVARSEMDHLGQMNLRPEAYDVWARFVAIGRTSVTMESEIRDGDRVMARARVVEVNVDASGVPIPWHEKHRALFEARIGLMDLFPVEPDLGPWRAVDDASLLALVGTPGLVLVDGRSGAGKTTFATRLAGLLDADLAHTDDVAWNHSRFDWADLLVEHVLEPWRRGEPVDYRPPGWVTHGREGSVVVPAGRPLVVEGASVARASVAPLADLVVWVQSDRTRGRTRGIARDASYGTRTYDEAVAFWDDWMTEEEPYLAAERPWERAGLAVRGTPPDGSPEGVTLLATGPAGRAQH